MEVGKLRSRIPCAVNHYLCPVSMPLITFLDQICAHGFDAVGLTVAALEALPLQRLKRELEVRGLQVSSVNSAGFFLFDGEAALAQAKRNRLLVEQTAELECTRLNIIVGGSASQPLAAARQAAITHLARFAEEASRLGVSLLIEPLHPLNVRGNCCFNTISQIETVFSIVPGLRLNADLYHLWWDPDLEKLLRGDSVPIGLLQICDVATNETGQVPRRTPLGEGFLPWGEYVKAVRRTFPGAPVEIELFADQLPGRPVEGILSSSAAALTTLLEV